MCFLCAAFFLLAHCSHYVEFIVHCRSLICEMSSMTSQHHVIAGLRWVVTLADAVTRSCASLWKQSFFFIGVQQDIRKASVLTCFVSVETSGMCGCYMQQSEFPPYRVPKHMRQACDGSCPKGTSCQQDVFGVLWNTGAMPGVLLTHLACRRALSPSITMQCRRTSINFPSSGPLAL